MALLCRLSGKTLLQRSSQAAVWNYGMATSSKAAKGMERYWEKNRKLNRPLSPHLTIYQPQMTSMLSITNRITGVALVAPFLFGPLIYICGSGDLASYIQLIQTVPLGTALLQLTKLTMAFSLSFHYANGIRHLFWDNAMGFKLNTVLKTGYLVMGITAVMTAALMCL